MIDMSKLNQFWDTGDMPWYYNRKKTVNKNIPPTDGDGDGSDGKTDPYADPYASWAGTSDWTSQYGKGLYNILNERWMKGGVPSEPAASNIKQNWWFSPEWTGENVYRPDVGWQPYSDIASRYRSATEPVTWEQFQGWGLTPNQTFPGWYEGGDGTGAGGGDATIGGGGSTEDWTSFFNQMMNPDYQSYFSNYGTEYDPNSMYTPWQTQMAGDVFGEYAQGLTAEAPEEWDWASGIGQQMAESGLPTSQSDWYTQAKGVAQTDIRDAIQQAAEAAGLSGMRWSTPLGRSAQDIAGRRMETFGLESTSRELAAQEAARGRQMQAIPLLQQLGAGRTGLEENAMTRALTAAGQLGGIGQNQFANQLGLAGQAQGLGTTMQGLDQNTINQIYQQWSKTTPENNPWLQAALGLSTTSGMPQQYQQSSGSQWMSGIFSLLSMLGMFA